MAVKINWRHDDQTNMRCIAQPMSVLNRRVGAALAVSFMLVATLSGCTSPGQAPSSEAQDSQAAPEESVAAPPEGHSTSQQPSTEGATLANDVKEENEMKLSIEQTDVAVVWEENQAVADLRGLAANGPVVVGMARYGGFEQVGPLGTRLTTSDEQMTTQPGDIVLYAGNQISIFYGPNSWAYTKLGHIDDKTAEELADLLGNGDVSITITVE